jgi:hypothetical protein
MINRADGAGDPRGAGSIKRIRQNHLAGGSSTQAANALATAIFIVSVILAAPASKTLRKITGNTLFTWLENHCGPCRSRGAPSPA